MYNIRNCARYKNDDELHLCLKYSALQCVVLVLEVHVTGRIHGYILWMYVGWLYSIPATPCLCRTPLTLYQYL